VEVFFSLPDHAGRIRDWDETLEAVLDGLAQGERFGVRARVIVDVVRGIDMGLSREAMEVAARHRDAGVVGLTLGGEEGFPPEPYTEIFSDGRRAGLRSVPHAGETHGPASIRGAVEALGAERIGHGIRALEDGALVELLNERGIALDVCPTSNLRTRSVPSLAEHPLPAMLEAGLTCTLSSDDPSMFGSSLTGSTSSVARPSGSTTRRSPPWRSPAWGPRSPTRARRTRSRPGSVPGACRLSRRPPATDTQPLLPTPPPPELMD